MVLEKFANKSFVTRTLSGIVLVAVMLATIIPGGNILFVANMLISLVGVYELYKVLGLEKKIPGVTGYVAVVAYYALIYFGKNEYIITLFVVFLICLLAQYVFMFPEYKTEQISNAIMCMLYAGVLLSYIYLVREESNGAYTVWLIFLCSWGSDTCAYLAGVAFGKHKMAPVLSPKKSIEGAVGGVIGAAALGAIYAAIFADKIQLSINPIIAFNTSNRLIHKNINIMGIVVPWASSIATGTFTTQIKPLSNIKVIMVLPPLLRVKYAAFVKALKGVATTKARINLVARYLISPVVLYILGKNMEAKTRIAETPRDISSEKTIIFLSVSFASSIFPRSEELSYNYGNCNSHS